MNSYYSFLEDEDMVDKSPMRKIHHIKEEKHVKKPFSDEEIERLNESANTPKERAVIAFLSTTACRVGELVGVKRGDVDMQEREVKVFGKGGKERVTFFDAKTKLALEDYLATRDDTCPFLFVNDNGGEKHACTTGSIERLVAKVGKRAEVDNAHPHRFRRTVATRAIDRGMPIEQVKELLGHSQIQTTMIYASVSKENVKASHRKYVS
jgi:site-specific recombinase XerD